MRIHVSSLARVHDEARRVQPSHIVSLLGPDMEFPDIEGFSEHSHHRVKINDIRAPQDGLVAPAEHHVEQLIAFLQDWSHDQPVLIHCWAGISRSSASAMIAAAIANPSTNENDIADAIAAASPTAFPNTLLVAHADSILQREGRLAEAAERICADDVRQQKIWGIEEAVPFDIPAKF